MSDELVSGRGMAHSPVVYPIGGPSSPSDASGLSKQILLQFLLVAFKWKWLILGLSAAFGIAAGIGLYLKPPQYQASARILLKPDRTALQISGMASNMLKNPFYPTQIMQSEVELLKSRAVLLPVARAVLQRDGTVSVAGGAAETDAEIESKVSGLTTNLLPVALPDTNVIEIIYSAASRPEALSTLTTIVENYLEQHAIAQGGSAKLLGFYRHEAERVTAELKAAEDELRNWQERAQVVSVDEEASAWLEQLTSRQQALNSLGSQVESVDSRISVLREQLKREPSVIVTLREKIANPLVSRLKTDLIAAENTVRDTERDPLLVKLRTDLLAADMALQDLLARYTEKDRRVQEKRDQVELLRRELKEANMRGHTAAGQHVASVRKELEAAERDSYITGREVTGSNPVRDRLESDLSQALAQASSLRAERDIVRRQVDELRRTLDSMREKKIEAARRGRTVDALKDEYLLYRKRLDEARLSAGLDKEELANVAVIDRPHGLSGGDLRKRLAIGLLAPALGLGLGLAIALCVEFFRNTIRTADDVEQYLALPVLATIPELRGQPVKALGTGEA